jgi:subtilase family serine protease
LSVFQGNSLANPALSQNVAQPTLPSAPQFEGGSPGGLSPGQVTTAYGLSQINFGNAAGDGAGQTIAIIDAFFDPNIGSDLARFDSQFGLSAPPSFNQYVENGLYGNDPGWALETALDVEWAHAIAPAANITLVEAQPNLPDMFNAVRFASHQSGVSVVSMSWGASEFPGEAAYDSMFTTPTGHSGITFVAASGDSGTTLYPSSSPNVLSVGGTTLNVTGQGQYLSETGWSGSGGGYSPYEAKPSWQTNSLPGTGRTTPDVAFNANPSTGVSVYSSINYNGHTGWFTVGGTSVGAPSWAGLIAIADQGLAKSGVGPLANAQSSLYQIPNTDFNAITSGSNGYYKAGLGYNLVTGLGTPRGNLLIPGLVNLNAGSPKPVPLRIHHAPTTSGSGSLLLVTSGSTAAAGSSSSSSSSQSSNTSITALNTNFSSTNGANTVVVIYVVPPPVVIHLTASSAPATIQQSNSSILSAQDEQPTSLTHFGQGDDDNSPLPIIKPTSTEVRPASFLDYVEPFQPLNPADAPAGDPALPPGAFNVRPLSGPFEASDFAVDSALLGSWFDRSTGAEKPLGENSGSWGVSTVFGAAVVALGGYHLAIREADRSKGRPFSRRVFSGSRTWCR